MSPSGDPRPGCGLGSPSHLRFSGLKVVGKQSARARVPQPRGGPRKRGPQNPHPNGPAGGLATPAQMGYGFRMTGELEKSTHAVGVAVGDPGTALADVLPPPGALRVYNPEQAGRVLWRISEGETVQAACRAEDVSWQSWFYWMLRLPELERMHRAARRIAAFRHFDRAQDQVDRLVEQADSLSANQIKAITAAQGALRDMAAVLNPSEFGERREATPPVSVKIVTTLELRPGSKPPIDHGSVYELAVKAMGTVGPEMLEGAVVPDGTRVIPLAKRHAGDTAATRVKVYEGEGVKDVD